MQWKSRECRRVSVIVIAVLNIEEWLRLDDGIMECYYKRSMGASNGMWGLQACFFEFEKSLESWAMLEIWRWCYGAWSMQQCCR